MTANADADWMNRALLLAAKGRGHVEPNPLVGAVIVRDGTVVGEGWHERFGGAHAEVHALNQAGASARGATLYVTLEPCCHHGKTPPCTDAIVGAGVARVVAAMSDPFPEVAGKGAEQLRRHGIAVDVGVCEDAARHLNAPYLKLLRTDRPYVIAKWAMSLDGKIATRTGNSKWISNEAARRRVHEWRGRMDAIVVGIGTALADNPLLTARPSGPRMPLRVVLDSKGRLPATSQLATTAREVPVMVVTAGHEARHLRDLGCEILNLGHDRVDIGMLLDELGRRRMTNILVEGGAETLAGFLPEIDEVRVFVAPLLIGGTAAPSPLAGLGADLISRAVQLGKVKCEQIGDNWLLCGQRTVISNLHSDDCV